VTTEDQPRPKPGRGGKRPGAGRKKGSTAAKAAAEATAKSATIFAPPNKGGRPSVWRPEFVEQARRLCEFGATDSEVAFFFEVTKRTLYRWIAERPELCAAMAAGKAPADERVVRSLYQRAVGYERTATKVFMPPGADAPVYAEYIEHVPPDTVAGIFWVKNRRPREWRDRHVLTGDDDNPIKLEVRQFGDPAALSTAELTAAIEQIRGVLTGAEQDFIAEVTARTAEPGQPGDAFGRKFPLVKE
jgi:hypothetical protein